MNPATLTEAERYALRDLVYHRFVQFEPGMNLILRSEPTMIGRFKVVEQSKGDFDVPADYLNSLKHIDAPDFIPDLAHGPTLTAIAEDRFPGSYFEFHSCQVWKEKGWRLRSDTSVLSEVHETKASALIWAMCLAPPF